MLSPFTLVDGVQHGLLGARTGSRPARPAPLQPWSSSPGSSWSSPGASVPGAALPKGVDLVSTLALDSVSRWYGNVVAVNDVTMTIGPGVTGLLGPNGAGKSTLIHMMAGFLAPSSGTVTLDGAGVAQRGDLPPDRSGPRARGHVRRRDRLGVRPRQRQAARAARSAGRRPPRAGDRADDGGAGPRHLHLLQGHETAGQDGHRSFTTPRCCCSTSRSTGWTHASACT